jgi:hypothetical protein
MRGLVSSVTAWNWFKSAMVMRAKASRSLFKMALEVSTVRCMPDVLDVPFLASEMTKMRAWMLGQWDLGAGWTARESVPSGREPISHATKPPKRERQAEPEPWRAMRESSEGVQGRR